MLRRQCLSRASCRELELASQLHMSSAAASARATLAAAPPPTGRAHAQAHASTSATAGRCARGFERPAKAIVDAQGALLDKRLLAHTVRMRACALWRAKGSAQHSCPHTRRWIGESAPGGRRRLRSARALVRRRTGHKVGRTGASNAVPVRHCRPRSARDEGALYAAVCAALSAPV